MANNLCIMFCQTCEHDDLCLHKPKHCGKTSLDFVDFFEYKNPKRLASGSKFPPFVWKKNTEIMVFYHGKYNILSLPTFYPTLIWDKYFWDNGGGLSISVQLQSNTPTGAARNAQDNFEKLLTEHPRKE